MCAGCGGVRAVGRAFIGWRAVQGCDAEILFGLSVNHTPRGAKVGAREEMERQAWAVLGWAGLDWAGPNRASGALLGKLRAWAGLSWAGLDRAGPI